MVGLASFGPSTASAAAAALGPPRGRFGAVAASLAGARRVGAALGLGAGAANVASRPCTSATYGAAVATTTGFGHLATLRRASLFALHAWEFDAALHGVMFDACLFYNESSR